LKISLAHVNDQNISPILSKEYFFLMATFFKPQQSTHNPSSFSTKKEKKKGAPQQNLLGLMHPLFNKSFDQFFHSIC
jgi:hypothetical protein